MIAKILKVLKNKYVIIAFCVIAVLLASAVVVIEVGEARLRQELSFEDDFSSEEAYGDSAEVFHNGQGYVYNENLINILCIGVDKNEISDKRYRQADALYLLSLDTESKKLNILAISRNTLADIDIYDIDNEFLDTDNAQICLSYVYGKDDKHSSMLTSKAVSKFLYDLPINSYYTIFMDGVATVVDSVGGVKIELPIDMSFYDKTWKKGNEITLNGSNVLRYLQYREESNEPRMNRHIGFIKAFISSAKHKFKKDLSLPVDIYKKVAENSVTDIDITQVSYLATEVSDMTINFHSLEGKTGSDGIHETFIADEKSLYETVLKLFYIKTNKKEK